MLKNTKQAVLFYHLILQKKIRFMYLYVDSYSIIKKLSVLQSWGISVFASLKFIIRNSCLPGSLEGFHHSFPIDNNTMKGSQVRGAIPHQDRGQERGQKTALFRYNKSLSELDYSNETNINQFQGDTST